MPAVGICALGIYLPVLAQSRVSLSLSSIRRTASFPSISTVFNPYHGLTRKAVPIHAPELPWNEGTTFCRIVRQLKPYRHGGNYSLPTRGGGRFGRGVAQAGTQKLGPAPSRYGQG